MTEEILSLRTMISILRDGLDDFDKEIKRKRIWTIFKLDKRYGTKQPVWSDSFIDYHFLFSCFMENVITSLRLIDDRLSKLEREKIG